MEFLKNHYEKVLLSVVLLALAVAVAILPMRVPTTPVEGGTNVPPVKLKALDLTTNEAALAGLVGLKPVVFSGEHNLFSPVEWRRTPDGRLIKIAKDSPVGLRALIVSRINPLYYILGYEGYSDPRFQMGVTQQNSRTSPGKVMKYVTLNEKQDTFTVVGTKGAKDNPTELVVELKDGQRVTVTKDKPFQMVVDYSADLTYPSNAWSPTPLVFPRQRVGDKLHFDQDTNNIVAIGSNEVVMSSSSGKRMRLPLKAAP